VVAATSAVGCVLTVPVTGAAVPWAAAFRALRACRRAARRALVLVFLSAAVPFAGGGPARAIRAEVAEAALQEPNPAWQPAPQ
jgi:hypothetical protein